MIFSREKTENLVFLQAKKKKLICINNSLKCYFQFHKLLVILHIFIGLSSLGKLLSTCFHTDL